MGGGGGIEGWWEHERARGVCVCVRRRRGQAGDRHPLRDGKERERGYARTGDQCISNSATAATLPFSPLRKLQININTYKLPLKEGCHAGKMRKGRMEGGGECDSVHTIWKRAKIQSSRMFAYR